MSGRKNTKQHIEGVKRKELTHQLIWEEKCLNRELCSIGNEVKKVLNKIDAEEKVLVSEYLCGSGRNNIPHPPLVRKLSCSGAISQRNTREKADRKCSTRLTTRSNRDSTLNDARRTKKEKPERKKKNKTLKDLLKKRRRSHGDLVEETKDSKDDEINVKLNYKCQEEVKDSLIKKHADKKLSRSLENLEATSNCSVESNPPTSDFSDVSSDEDVFNRKTRSGVLPAVEKDAGVNQHFLVVKKNIPSVTQREPSHHDTAHNGDTSGDLVSDEENKSARNNHRRDLSRFLKAEHKDDTYDPVKEWHKRLDKKISSSSVPGDSSPHTMRRILTKQLSSPLPCSSKNMLYSSPILGEKQHSHLRRQMSCFTCKTRKNLLADSRGMLVTPRDLAAAEDSDNHEFDELRKCRYLRFSKHVKTFPEDLIDLKECSKFLTCFHKLV